MKKLWRKIRELPMEKEEHSKCLNLLKKLVFIGKENIVKTLFKCRKKREGQIQQDKENEWRNNLDFLKY